MPMVQYYVHYIITAILLNLLMVIISELDKLLTQQPVPLHGFDSTSLSLKRPRQCVAGLGGLLDPCFTPTED